MHHGDTYMSPKNRFGHTSSPWWHERGAECRTSSSSWRDWISPVAHMRSSFTSGFVSLLFFESLVSHFTPVTAPEGVFLSAIATFMVRMLLQSLLTAESSLLPVHFYFTHLVTVANRWRTLAQPHKLHKLHKVSRVITLFWRLHVIVEMET